MRLFVALTPPAQVVEDLRIGITAVRQLAPDLRWTRPEQWHLTLAFLGEVGEAGMADLTTRLGRAATRHPPLTLSFCGAGRFGHRVLWTGVRGDRDGLRRLADSVRAAARRTGVALEQQPYRPHLTLARSDGSGDLRPLVRRLDDYQGRPWDATRLHLVRSRLRAGPGGTALHETVADWPLGGQPGRTDPENSAGT